MLRSIAFLASVLSPLLLAPAQAVTFSSGANATSTHIAVGGLAAADAVVAPASGTAAPAYNNTGGVASVNQNFALTSGLAGSANQALTTGVVSTSATSNAPAQTFATATANVANANSALGSKLLGDLSLTTALGISADALSSSTTVGLDGSGNLFGTGSSSITNLALTGSVLGLLNIDGSLYTNPLANTVLFSTPGLTVTLNEQLRTQTSSSLLMQTNAIHLALNDYSLAGKLLSGDVILGHSEAGVTGAVPEPATWAMMLAGFGAIGFTLRRRRPSLSLA